MKIVFDARMIRHSGIGTQVRNVLSGLIQQKNLDLTLLGEKTDIEKSLPDYQGNLIPWSAPIYSLKEQLFFPGLPKDAILHMPHYNAPLSRMKQSVVVVHDLIHLQSDEFQKAHYRLYTQFLLSQVAKNARKIITVSETTRQELLMRFPGAAEKTSVLYNGIDHTLFVPQKESDLKEFRKKYSLPARYLLVVGIGKRHKNVDFVIRSLAPLWKKKTLKLPLVLAGTGGVIPDYVTQEIRINQVESHIQVLPHLLTEELPMMYGAAEALIMPSLFEGFGFPIVEAMASGTPVLCSNASSLPEIAGNAAFLFDPRNSADFTHQLSTLMEKEREKKEMIKKGLKRAQFFNWKRHVQDLLKIYESL